MQQRGRQSLEFEMPPYIEARASIVGKKEGEGPLGDKFDMICEDCRFGEDTWEKSESRMQKETAVLAVGKAHLKMSDIRYAFAGDLLGQTIATSFGIMELGIPLFGLYGACSTSGESMMLGAMCVAAGYADNVLTITSSHFASAEKQFRFPLGYGSQRPECATWTVTGSGAYVIGKKKSRIKISGVTTGSIVDYGIRDSMNMGAAMAPAAANVIAQNLSDLKREPGYYDRIITGDLGYVGKDIIIKLLREKGYDISDNHSDCGIEMFDSERQGTQSGGSGCGCAASVMAAHFLNEVENGNLRKILFVPTGALLSTVSFNEGQNVPGIAQAVVIEYEENI